MDSGRLTDAFNSTPSQEKVGELIAAAAQGDVAAVTAFLDHYSKKPDQTINRSPPSII